MFHGFVVAWFVPLHIVWCLPVLRGDGRLNNVSGRRLRTGKANEHSNMRALSKQRARDYTQDIV